MKRPSAQAVVLAAALVLPLVAALAKVEPPLSDAALFEYYGRALAHGSRLYLDLWDNKLPSIYLANAVLQALFGTRYVLHALAEGAVAAASVALFAFVLRRSAIRHWEWAALAFAVFLTLPPATLDSVETFAVAAILGAYALAFAGRSVASVVVLGVATTFWLPSVLMVAPLLAREPQRRARIALALAGTLVAYAAAMLLAFGAPALAELARSWVAYGAQSFGGRMGAHGGRLGVLEPVVYALVTSGAGVLLAVLAAVVRRPRSEAERFALLWTACALVAALALGNFYAHYFIPLLAPCIFAIAAFGADRRLTLRRAAFAVVVLFFAVRTVVFEVRAVPLLRAETRDKEIIAAHVRALAGPGAVIDVFPYEPAFFLLADAVGEDRFGVVPPRVRPAQRPDRREPVVLLRWEASDVAAPDDPPMTTCERVYGWIVAVPRSAPREVAQRCRALGSSPR